MTTNGRVDIPSWGLAVNLSFSQTPNPNNMLAIRCRYFCSSVKNERRCTSP